MKWSIYSEETSTENISDGLVAEFVNSLHELQRSTAQYLDAESEIKMPAFNLGQHFERLGPDDHDGYYLGWYHALFLPIPASQIFLRSRTRYLQRSIERLTSAVASDDLFSVAFFARHILETAASLWFGSTSLNRLITEVAETELFSGLSIEERKKYQSSFLDRNGEFMSKIWALLDQIGRITSPTAINLQGIDDGFDSNRSLRPIEGELGYSLIPKSVLTALQKFEKAVIGLHPSYDLLSEFLHPNSYVLFSQIKDTDGTQFAFETSGCEDDQLETIQQFFVRTQIHKVIANAVNEAMMEACNLAEANSLYTSKIKQIINSTLGLTNFSERISKGEYSTFECLCGSGRLMHYCCVKTSDKDKKRLEKYGKKLRGRR